MSAERARCDDAAELALRELAPRVLGAVARRCGDFAAAEDAVQEALLAAAVAWPAHGTPENPGGWLFQVACRRLADQRDAERARRRRESIVAAEMPAAEPPPDVRIDEGELAPDGDDTLALLFTCCHPSLAPTAAIALTLRAVGGLTTAAIAKAFLVPEATMAQRICRAKQAIQESGLPFELPGANQRAERQSAVLHVLYLMFNEGYASSAGPDLLRADLSSEAIRLTRLLQRLTPEHAETTGLLALLLLTDARRSARRGPHGELVPLDEQDRARWDRAAIAEGTALVAAAFARGVVGSYALQAAIAALHDEAPSTAATDWPQILALYGVLQRLAPNPVFALNRAIAIAMVHGPRAGLDALRALDAEERLAGSHRLLAARAHLLELSGDAADAIRAYLDAATRTANLAEKQYLAAKATRLAARSGAVE